MEQVLEMIHLRTLLIPALLGLVACSPSETGESLANRALSVGQPKTQSILQSIRYLEQKTHDAPRLKGGIESTGSASLAVLDTKRNGVETWLAPGGQSFALRNGVLINTRGLEDDLMSSEVSQTIAAVLGHREQDTARYMSFIGPETQTIQRQFACHVKPQGDATINIDGAGVKTTIMSEKCSDSETEFVNLYWMRKSDNVIVQSRQWASESIGPIVLREQPI